MCAYLLCVYSERASERGGRVGEREEEKEGCVLSVKFRLVARSVRIRYFNRRRVGDATYFALSVVP